MEQCFHRPAPFVLRADPQIAELVSLRHSTVAMASGATLRIKLASSGSSEDEDTAGLVADRFVLDFWSSCARGLPKNAAEWDLSKLLIEGKPVERSTVVAWLNITHQLTHTEDFEQQLDKPAVRMTGLAQLLAFADAVGSNRGVLNACLSMLDVLMCDVTTSSADNFMFSLNNSLRFTDVGMFNNGSYVFGPAAAEESKNAMQQIITSLETLLYLSYKLRLPALQTKIQRIIYANRCSPYLLHGRLDEVVSARVLHGAAGNPELLRQLVVKNLTTP